MTAEPLRPKWLEEIQAQIEETLPIGQMLDIDSPPEEVVEWLSGILVQYFDNEIRPGLESARLTQGHQHTDERSHVFGEPGYYSDIRNAFSSLFKGGMRERDKNPQECKITIRGVKDSAEGVANCLAAIEFDIGIYAGARRLKDGDPGWYPITFNLVLVQFKKGYDIYKILLKSNNKGKKAARSLARMSRDFSRAMASALEMKGIANPLQGGAADGNRPSRRK